MSTAPGGPRCLHPMTFYDYAGRADFEPVCWRPAGHGPRRDGQPGHLSRYAVENIRARRRGISHKKKRPPASPAGMSDPRSMVAA